MVVGGFRSFHVKIMISLAVNFLMEYEQPRCTRKVSFIVVQLISLETCHFSFWSASFKLNQLEIL